MSRLIMKVQLDLLLQQALILLNNGKELIKILQVNDKELDEGELNRSA